jgi:flagellar FliL protein
MAAQKETPAKPGGKKKLFIIIALIAIGAGWYLYMGKASGGDKPEEHKAGEVVLIDPIQVNLEDGHYLRIGVALQLEEGAHEVTGAQALDSAIATFSGRPVGDVNTAAVRDELKAELLKQLKVRYEGHVMDVYFTDFVTQ